jgi:hypothetical protein
VRLGVSGLPRRRYEVGPFSATTSNTFTSDRRNCRGTTPTSPPKPFVTSSTSGRGHLGGDLRATMSSGFAHRVELAQLQAHLLQRAWSKGFSSQLRLAHRDQPALDLEAGCGRAGAASPARRGGVEELGRAREDPEGPLESVGCVDDLPDAVERLSAHVAPHAQNGLGLVDDDDEALVARGLHDLEHAAQVGHRVGALISPLMPASFFVRRWNVLAAREPRHERAASRTLPCCFSSKIVAKHAAEVLRHLAVRCARRCPLRCFLSTFRSKSGASGSLPADRRGLDLGDPAVETSPSAPRGQAPWSPALDDLAVDVVEAVEVQIVVGDDDEARGEVALLRKGIGDGRRARKVLPQP